MYLVSMSFQVRKRKIRKIDKNKEKGVTSPLLKPFGSFNIF